MVDGAEENGFIVLLYGKRVSQLAGCRSESGSIQRRLFVRLWDLRRVGWVDRGWSRGRGPKWPLLDVRWRDGTILGTTLGSVPALIDIFRYVIATLTCRWSQDCLH